MEAIHVFAAMFPPFGLLVFCEKLYHAKFLSNLALQTRL